MPKQTNPTVLEVSQRIYQTFERFHAYAQSNPWYFIQEDLPNGFLLDLSLEGWEQIDLPYSFDGRKGGGWFRTEYNIPNEVEGFAIKDMELNVYSDVFFDAMEVYVNQKIVFKDRFWADMRGPRIQIAAKANPGERYVIAVHFHPKEGTVSIPKMQLHFPSLEESIFELRSFSQELVFADFLPDSESILAPILDTLRQTHWEQVALQNALSTIHQARKDLEPLRERAKSFRVHVVGHAHIDMNWMWDWEDTVHVIGRDFKTMTDLLERYPDLTFCHPQTATYQVAETHFPELFEKIKHFINKGQWQNVAGTWVEGDLNMAAGEASARQMLYAKRYAQHHFGEEVKICWEPDTFGHPANMPQICKEAGIEHYYFMRCGKNEPVFWWEGMDGSRVLAINSIYTKPLRPEDVVADTIEVASKYTIQDMLLVIGVGDHGGGPTVEDYHRAHRMNEAPTMPTIQFGSVPDYYELVKKEGDKLPVVRGELNYIFDGCYTTQNDIKYHNRKCETKLVDAEVASVLAQPYHGYPNLNKAWEHTLFNQFHDILDGSGIQCTYDYSDALATEAENLADHETTEALRALASRVETKQEGLAMMVFNPMGWERTDIVDVELVPGNYQRMKAVSCDGIEVPVQIVGNRAYFVASNVPALGYKTFYLKEGLCDSALAVNQECWEIENAFYTISFDPESGCFERFLDKRNGKEVFKRLDPAWTKPYYSNEFQVLWEIPHPMSSWTIGGICREDHLIRGAKLEWGAIGPVFADLHITHHPARSVLSQTIRVYHELERIDFFTRLDWREVADYETDAPMLKVAFTPNLNTARAVYEIPFGIQERIANGREVPALQWMDLSDDTYGVCLLNDSKYGHDTQGNTMRLTLCRTGYDPDPRSDIGIWECAYGLVPHEGNWKDARAYQKGYDFNHPFRGLVIRDQARESELPEKQGFLQLDASHIIVSALKKAEEGEGLIVRLYEIHGESTTVNVTLSNIYKEVQRVTIMEQEKEGIPIKNNQIQVKFRPHEIITLRLIP